MPNTTIDIQAKDSLELAAKKQILNTAAALPMDDLERIGQLVKNKKALSGLKDNWSFLIDFIK